MSSPVRTGETPRARHEVESHARLHRSCMSASAARIALVRMVLVVLAIGVLVPWLANAYWIKTLTSSLALAIGAAGVALLYGQLGLVSLCQYALLGVGGWVALRVAHGLAVAVRAVRASPAESSAGLLGMLAGLPALRLKGLYLALVTLMLAGGFQVVVSATGFPDGGAGLAGPHQRQRTAADAAAGARAEASRLTSPTLPFGWPQCWC